jgi:hypothetical protein
MTKTLRRQPGYGNGGDARLAGGVVPDSGSHFHALRDHRARERALTPGRDTTDDATDQLGFEF